MNHSYIYHSPTRMLCPECMSVIEGKVVIEGLSVFQLGMCPVHGEIKTLRETDKEWYLNRYSFDKAGTNTKRDTVFKNGCPHDCGICPGHDQHTCIGLIEITNRCNLECEMCYAASSTGKDLSLKKIESMLDYYQEAENGDAEILQISGGEPTLHPHIIDVIKEARRREFKYVMLNTNGIRIAEDQDFVKALSEFKGRFEIYLQFDGLEDGYYKSHRGKNLLETKLKAIENLISYSIPITLVVTVSEFNKDHLGEIVAYAMDKHGIRGVNFQPLSQYGEEKQVTQKNEYSSITLTDVLNAIEDQTVGAVRKKDFVPLPCNVERIAVSYFVKGKKGFVPILRHIDLSGYLPIVNNTLNFEMDDLMSKTGLLSCDCFKTIRNLKGIIPADWLLKSSADKTQYIDENTFRMTVTSFLDRYNFDVKSAQKECVHVITPELKRIPFSTYNMMYRK